MSPAERKRVSSAKVSVDARIKECESDQILKADGKFQQESESTQGSHESIHSIASTSFEKKTIPMTDAEKIVHLD